LTEAERRRGMSKANGEVTIRRILVALDASHHSLAALEAAAELAASLEAELQGLFVEDVNLLRVAGSPVAREVRYPSATAVRLDPARMERALRAQATQARRAIAVCCRQRRVKWSFRVVRGEVAPEVLAAATGADLLSLGKASRPLVGRALRVHLGSTAQAVATQAPGPVLLLQRDVGIRAPVIVAYDGSPTSRQALMIASRLAQKHGGYLSTLILAGTPEDLRRLKDEISGLLRGRRLMLRYRRLTDAGAATLTHELRSEGSGMLVLSSTIMQPDAVCALLDEVECPVLLVRS
jgi:nucleotide-binding universal stress UspA family protein